MPMPVVLPSMGNENEDFTYKYFKILQNTLINCFKNQYIFDINRN